MRAPCMRAVKLLLVSVCLGPVALACAPEASGAVSPGTLNSGFGDHGIAAAGAGTRLFGDAVQSNGDTVVVGETGVGSNVRLLLERFGTSGGLDGSFGSGGKVTGPAITGADAGSLGRGVAIQSDGKIVVVGGVTDSASGRGIDGMLIERYNANGSLDGSFGSGGIVTALTGSQSGGGGYAVAIQPDGKIIATGSANAAGSGGTLPRVALVRLNTSGGLDSSFGSNGIDVIDLGAFSSALAVALQGDGKIVIAGQQSPGLQVPIALIARLTASGSPDPSFHGTGSFAQQYAIGSASSSFNAVAVQGDGKIVAAGDATDGNTGADTILVRFTSGGAPDGSFGSAGVARTTSGLDTTQFNSTVAGASGLTIAPNGDLIAAGDAADGLMNQGALWAFTSSGALDGAFGSSGTVKINVAAGDNSELAAVALAPSGDLLAAGDQGAPFSGSYAGLVASYGGFGAPKPPPIPPLAVSIKGLSRSYKTGRVANRGLKLSVGCNEACTIQVSLGVSAGTAKRLRVLTTIKRCKKVHGHQRCVKAHVYRALTLATGRATLKASGSKAFVLKLKHALLKPLGKQKSVSVSLSVSVTSTATHKHKSTTQRLTFKR
jgi:uncharacterized delta-60 repeat protein